MPELAAGDIKFYAQNIKSGSFVAYGFGIYAGTTDPTTYTPYIGQTNTLTLPETVYGGEVDAVTGEGQKVWKSVALDGTENWNTWGVNKNNTNVTGFLPMILMTIPMMVVISIKFCAAPCRMKKKYMGWKEHRSWPCRFWEF